MVTAVRIKRLDTTAIMKSSQVGQLPGGRIQIEKKAGASSRPPNST